eukprot:TRINITY_DN1954_c0_g1_i1.p1 TRINITY_DN1954_c0_g1~~TRINITY_DN1954_c0_g1_i1.p1  ORF type:complete len:1330 (-),score=270.90 TRINITY_DN1954_c0_g1_i1:189-4178(-)
MEIPLRPNLNNDAIIYYKLAMCCSSESLLEKRKLMMDLFNEEYDTKKNHMLQVDDKTYRIFFENVLLDIILVDLDFIFPDSKSFNSSHAYIVLVDPDDPISLEFSIAFSKNISSTSKAPSELPILLVQLYSNQSPPALSIRIGNDSLGSAQHYVPVESIKYSELTKNNVKQYLRICVNRMNKYYSNSSVAYETDFRRSNFVLHQEEFSNKMNSDLTWLLKDDIFSDITFRFADNLEIKAHRFVLGTRYPPLISLLLNKHPQNIDWSGPVVHLPTQFYNNYKTIITAIYEGKYLLDFGDEESAKTYLELVPVFPFLENDLSLYIRQIPSVKKITAMLENTLESAKKLNQHAGEAYKSAKKSSKSVDGEEAENQKYPFHYPNWGVDAVLLFQDTMCNFLELVETILREMPDYHIAHLNACSKVISKHLLLSFQNIVEFHEKLRSTVKQLNEADSEEEENVNLHGALLSEEPTAPASSTAQKDKEITFSDAQNEMVATLVSLGFSEVRSQHAVHQMGLKKGNNTNVDHALNWLLSTANDVAYEVPLKIVSKKAPNSALKANIPSSVDEEKLNNLMSMGFPRNKCIQALNQNISVDRAVEWLLTNADGDDEQVEEDPESVSDIQDHVVDQNQAEGPSSKTEAEKAATGNNKDEELDKLESARDLMHKTSAKFKPKLLEALMHLARLQGQSDLAVKARIKTSGAKRINIAKVIRWFGRLFGRFASGSEEISALPEDESGYLLKEMLGGDLVRKLNGFFRKVNKFPNRFSKFLVFLIRESKNEKWWQEMFGIWDLLHSSFTSFLKCFGKKKLADRIDSFVDFVNETYKPKEFVSLDTIEGLDGFQTDLTNESKSDGRNIEDLYKRIQVKNVSLFTVTFDNLSLESFLKDERFGDIEFLCSDGIIKAHRAILCRFSQYFRDVLHGVSDSTISKTKQYLVEEVRLFLQFLYNSSKIPSTITDPKILKNWKLLYQFHRLLDDFGFSSQSKEITKLFVDNFEDINRYVDSSITSGYEDLSTSSCALPVEVWPIVITFSSLYDLVNISQVCKLFYRISKSSNVIERCSILPFPNYVPTGDKVTKEDKEKILNTISIRSQGKVKKVLSPMIFNPIDKETRDIHFSIILEKGLKMWYRNIDMGPEITKIPLYGFCKKLQRHPNIRILSDTFQNLANNLTKPSVVYIGEDPYLIQFSSYVTRDYFADTILLDLSDPNCLEKFSDNVVQLWTRPVFFLLGIIPSTKERRASSLEVRKTLFEEAEKHEDVSVYYFEIKENDEHMLQTVIGIISHVLYWKSKLSESSHLWWSPVNSYQFHYDPLYTPGSNKLNNEPYYASINEDIM